MKETNNKPNRSIRKVKLDIAAAKRAMDATTRGTPERDAAFLRGGTSIHYLEQKLAKSKG